MTDIRHEALMGLARISVILMTEFLPEGLPKMPAVGWRWLRNVPKGPSPEGIAALQAAQAEHGLEYVTTGNACPPHPGQVGLYVRVRAGAAGPRRVAGALVA